uniref:Uncharacterized protein n=1 Tax=Streptomyces sp. NBC_01401 TaxID=2903854 RepID=A0AAU3GU73_9ACTN
MDVPTLVLLGAAGGLLRGVLDLYARFVSWQADRRVHRRLTADGTAREAPPQFRAYFDPAVDIVAAVLHSGMGAGAAVLFGTTGQINGEYATIVVGMSAPMLLTQLSRIQTVNESLTAVQQSAEVTEVTEVAETASGDAAGEATQAGALSAAAPRAEPSPAPPTGPDLTPLPPEGTPVRVPPVPSPRPTATTADPADGPAPRLRQGPAAMEEEGV